MDYPAYLESLPTLAVGQTADLKIAGDRGRVWLSRCADEGEPLVMCEALIDGRWVDVTDRAGEYTADPGCRQGHFHGNFCTRCGGWA